MRVCQNHKIVALAQLLLTELDVVAVVHFLVGLALLLAAEFGEEVRQTVGDVRVQPAKQRDVDRILQHFLEEAVAVVVAAQTVSVQHKETPPEQARIQAGTVHLNAQRGRQEVAYPEIVVARHVVDPHPALYEQLQTAEHAEVARGDHVPVLEPEVEQVPHDDQAIRGRVQVVEKPDEVLSFVGLALGIRCPQVGIRDEKHAFGGASSHRILSTRLSSFVRHQRITAEAQANPAPNAASTTMSPSRIRPC